MATELSSKNNVMFVRAGDGFIPEGIRGEGYRVEKPFYEKGLLLRVIREAWFRLRLPFKEIFYNKCVEDFDGKTIIIYDPQITTQYLIWLKKHHSEKTIIFFYGNMVGHARHITPEKIPEGIDCWTYERSDSEKYGIGLNQRMAYYMSYVQPKKPTEYDVMYVGRDKGRIDFLCSLEKELNRAGLKTFFRIVGDTRFEKKKDKRYGSALPYNELCGIIARSKAILNVTLPRQEGMTMRDFEAICNNVKLITTNSTIKNKEFYDPAKILVIDEVDANKIKEFLDTPCEPYDPRFREDLSWVKWIEEMNCR